MDIPIGSLLILQFVFLVISACLSMMETMILSLSESKVRKLEESGKVDALLRIAQEPFTYLNTIQLLTVANNLLACSFSVIVLVPYMMSALKGAEIAWLSDTTLLVGCVIVIVMIHTFFIVVFGKQLPSRMATHYSVGVTRFFGGVVVVVHMLSKPFVWLQNITMHAILYLVKIDPNAKSEEVTEEEIRLLVDIGSENGAIEQNERALIENIFEFGDLVAQDIMLHRKEVIAIHIEDDFADILATIRASGRSRFPVYENSIDHIIGVLNTREFLLNVHVENPKTLRQLLRSPHLVPESISAYSLFNDMQKKKIHMSIVVDEFGGTSGIVTMEDLLEEIVGNIYDEFDPNEAEEIERIADNLWRVSGSVELEQLSDTLNMPLPLNEDFDTLGGLVLSRFSHIPEDGSCPEVIMHGLRIQVETIQAHRIEKALVSLISQADETVSAEADGQSPSHTANKENDNP